MDIYRAGTRPSRKANADWFTGTVWQDPVIEAPEPARIRALRVGFEPGARTAWHTHPMGQTLHVLSGVGLVGLRGKPPKVIRAGDTVWIPPGEEHWHGAGPETGMVHLAMQEAHEGRVADWLEQVSDADYRVQPE
ncbi:cupin domain-containing protein [Tropicibacter sp. Alg240-R139]|uniref:(R)-mandelonitrile lyase n=1 Tax=Tropicibacter sp. Alg240-R139 TaxID=2305991 RepID=UPI0013E070EB|nr:cupin domain-containing protein [Tropicibacter sp. Alg240-R139]